MSYMSRASYHVFLRNVIKLTREGMNELKYDSVLRGSSVWNLHVTHVDPMSWSILQDRVTLMRCQQSHFNESVLSDFPWCGNLKISCSSRLLSKVFY